MHSPDLGIRVDRELQARNNSEKSQGSGGSKPLVIIFIFLDVSNRASSIDDIITEDDASEDEPELMKGPINPIADAAKPSQV